MAGTRDVLRRIARLVARPVRRARGRGGLVVETYRGYASSTELFLIGRVFRQTEAKPGAGDDWRTHLRDIGRRVRRRTVAGAAIRARCGEASLGVVTDRDGYFRVRMPMSGAQAVAGWRTVELTLAVEPPVQARGQVYLPPTGCRLIVVSDIDDTIMHTGVANKAKMLWRLFVADAESRVAFPGAASLYRALHAGPGGGEGNPMLYVSRAPWGIYDMLTAFFRLHEIPIGPVLFLREWGLSWHRPWPRRATDHKRVLIEHMLDLYRDLPFVLIGDSGQHDPEVYARIVETHPGRVKAVYIRDVSRGARRAGEIERLAAAVSMAGSHLVLAADSLAIAEHAERLGLIGPEATRAVLQERASGGAPRSTRSA